MTDLMKDMKKALDCTKGDMQEKVLVVQDRKQGQRMLQYLARQGATLLNVAVETPHSLALAVYNAQAQPQGSTQTVIDDAKAQELILTLLQEQPAGFYGEEINQTLRVAKALYDTFLALAMAEAPPLSAPEVGALGVTSSERITDTEALRQAYQAKKTELGYLDCSDLFVQAIALLKQGVTQPARRYIALSNLATTPLEDDFLGALTGGDFAQIRMPQGDALNVLVGNACTFRACRGIETEVRSALRDVVEQARNVEDCALVYLGSEYPQMLYEMAPRYEIPIALEGSIPLEKSNLFASLQGLQAWAAQGYPIKGLYTLLEHHDCAPESAMKLASFLRARPASCGKELYTLRDAVCPTGLSEQAWADWQVFLDCILAITDPVCPPDGSAQTGMQQAAAVSTQQSQLQYLLAHYCPLHRTGEGGAYSATLGLLASAAQMPARGKTLLARLLVLMQDSSYQPNASSDTALLCMSVEQALLSGRKTLYIVGLTRYALEDGGAESPILLDAEREKLSRALRTVQARAKRLAAQFQQLILTHQGELIFSYPAFESARMTQVFPAPFYAQALAKTQCTEQQVSYLAQTPLSAADVVVSGAGGVSPAANTVANAAGGTTPAANTLALGLASQTPAQGQPTPQGVPAPQGTQAPSASSTADASTLAARMDGFVFSASALESALACPLAFYLARVLRLQDDAFDEEKVGRWLTGGKRGTFVHAVLEQYYCAQIAHGADPTAPAPDLDAIYQTELARLEQENPCCHAAARQAKAEELPSIRKMIDDAIAWTTQQGRTVLCAEGHVGTTAQPISLVLSADKTIQFVGSVDRVDTNPTGKETYILDYKSGDIHSFQDKMPLHLQHYLYTLAYEQSHVGAAVHAAGYLLLGDDVVYQELVQDKALRDEMQKKVLALLAILSDETAIQTPCPCYRLEGEALVLGDEKTRQDAHETCKRYCPYSAVCAEYWKEKNQE